MDDANGARPSAWDWYTDRRLARWLVALVFVVFVGFIPASLGAYQVCEDGIAHVGNTAGVRVCGPPGVTDFPVVAGLFVVFVLLAPDLTEISIGVIGLKQQVRKQQEEVESQLRELRADLSATQLQLVDNSAEAAAVAAASASIVSQPLDLAAVVRELKDFGKNLRVDGLPPPTIAGHGLESFVDDMAELELVLNGLPDAASAIEASVPALGKSAWLLSGSERLSARLNLGLIQIPFTSNPRGSISAHR